MAGEFDLVVAGSGIAGLSAALTGARLGLRTLCLTGDVLGGQLLSINKIDGYPGFPDGIAGYDLCPMTQEQAVAAGAEIAAATVDGLAPQDGRWRLVTGDGEIVSRGVVLATGAALKELGVPGEERLRGKGVSHCASCDAPLLRGKPVVVIGGGDSACQEALTLAEAASKVTLLHRGAELSAQRAYRDAVMQQPNIEVRFHHVAEEILARAASPPSVPAARTVPAATSRRRARSSISAWRRRRPFSAARSRSGPRPDSDRRRAPHGVDRRRRGGRGARGLGGRAAASAGDGAAAAIAIANYLRQDRWRDG